MTRKVMFACVGFLGLSVLAGAAFSVDDPKKPEVPAFKKYVGLYTRTQPKAQLILERAEMKQMAGRTFICGTPVEAASNLGEIQLRPFKSAVRWVAWEEVIEFYEFDNARGLMADPR